MDMVATQRQARQTRDGAHVRGDGIGCAGEGVAPKAVSTMRVYTMAVATMHPAIQCDDVFGVVTLHGQDILDR